MTHRIFDEGNARHGVPASFLQDDVAREVSAPTCRGFWYRGVFCPLSISDDALCDANDVPQGVRWSDEHAWNAERDTYMRGECVRLIDPDRAAEMIATREKLHCHWDAERQTFVAWALRDWERSGERLARWANEFERETKHVNGTDGS